MATAVKEKEEKPEPAYLIVYLPNTNPDEVGTHFHKEFTEGEKEVKAIRWVSPMAVVVEYNNGRQTTFAGCIFELSVSPQPTKKKAAHL